MADFSNLSTQAGSAVLVVGGLTENQWAILIGIVASVTGLMLQYFHKRAIQISDKKHKEIMQQQDKEYKQMMIKMKTKKDRFQDS